MRTGYLAPYNIPGIQTVLHPRNAPRPRPFNIDIPNMVASPLDPPPPDHSGKYGGIYADSSWDIARNWSIDRKDKVRGLQKATTARDLGQIDLVEGFFHRIFGERGTTAFEMETSGERQKLLELIGEVTREIPKLPPGRAVGAGLAIANASRLAATYPDNPADLVNWRTAVAQVSKELKSYIPTNWASVALGVAALGAIVYGLHHYGVFGVSR